jgi:hypothetical protein
MAGGLIAIILFSTPAQKFLSFISTSSVGILVAGASALVGGLLGFLFGIPRTLQNEPNTERSMTSYRANTNLEQISDWLTKILVGVGLTQLSIIPGKLKSLSAFVAQGLGGTPKPSVLATAIIVFYGVCGFLFGYLWTRIYLATALKEADINALAYQVEQTGKKLSELEVQATKDATALSLTQRHLNPHPDLKEVEIDKLMEAIIGASPSVKTTIFYKAWDVRTNNWRDNKPIMERTIPIFRALKKSDVNKEYHMNHGQLGFALKDKRDPNWAEAEAELTEAIGIRGRWEEKGWLFYEFNRAICRIMLESTAADSKSREALREGILADLRSSTHSEELQDLIQKEPNIVKWMTKHKISIKDIET